MALMGRRNGTTATDGTAATAASRVSRGLPLTPSTRTDTMTQLDLKNYKNRHSLKSKAARLLWNATWLLLARWTPEHIRLFNRWRVLLLRLFGARIGKGCVIKPSCLIWAPWNLELKDRVALDDKVLCYTVAKITIGSHTAISRETFLCSASHDIASRSRELIHAPIEVGSKVWIAARAIILPGVTVGEGAVVGAGSVVARDVPPWTVVAGNPAREIKKRVLTHD